ncbi:MAG: hypothetical protein HS108_10760 [Planctomycetes bacterium]|jgi:hypothetical protein|nr:hypothetical protein [Planctomycetota bacterium]MCL4728817.1 hypothetical protein [Planctomycetota bacterium]
MNTVARLLLAGLVAAMAPAVCAQVDITGKDAPAFSANVCVNKPEAISMEQCKGEVVLIKYWGTR